MFKVALAFSNNDPLSFMSAFYGCITAGLIPVPVEVPMTKRVSDTGYESICDKLYLINYLVIVS